MLQPTIPARVRIEQYCPFCQRWLMPMASPCSNFSLRLVVRGISSDMLHRLDRLADPPLTAAVFANDAAIHCIALDRLAPRLADQLMELRDRQTLRGLGAGIMVNQLVNHGAVEV